MTGVCAWCERPWADHLSPRESALTGPEVGGGHAYSVIAGSGRGRPRVNPRRSATTKQDPGTSGPAKASTPLEAPSVVGIPADLPTDGASSGRTPKADGNSAPPPAAPLYDPIARLSACEQQLLDAA